MTVPQGSTSSAAQFNDQLSYWRSLKQQAGDGTFSLDTSLANDLKGHAETLLKHLNDELLPSANDLGYLTGFGSLPSSRALKSAFEVKAITAPDALIAQYKQAIDIVTTMRDTYDAVLSKFSEADHSAAAAISKQTEKL